MKPFRQTLLLTLQEIIKLGLFFLKISKKINIVGDKIIKTITKANITLKAAQVEETLLKTMTEDKK